MTSAGVCGSDLHAIEAGALSVVLGHEFDGRLDIGELVALQPFVACGECGTCTVGNGHLCATGQRLFHGATIDGGLADEAWVDQRTLVHLPPTVRAEDVALVEPIAVAVHAVNRAQVVEGERALVVGGATIGLLCTAVLRERGVEVTLTARHPGRESPPRPWRWPPRPSPARRRTADDVPAVPRRVPRMVAGGDGRP